MNPLAIRTKWQEIIPNLTDEDWEEACSSHLYVSPIANNRLIQLYMLHQSYLSPSRLYAMQSIASPKCLRCSAKRADFIHIMWFCPVISRFWQEIIQILSSVLNMPVPLTPETCLLGILDEITWSRYHKIMLRETLFTARKTITVKWIQVKPPAVKNWIRAVNQILPFEKVLYMHRGCSTKYNKIWDNWSQSTLTNG